MVSAPNHQNYGLFWFGLEHLGLGFLRRDILHHFRFMWIFSCGNQIVKFHDYPSSIKSLWCSCPRQFGTPHMHGSRRAKLARLHSVTNLRFSCLLLQVTLSPNRSTLAKLTEVDFAEGQYSTRIPDGRACEPHDIKY